MSQTYISILVMILAQVLPNFGFEVGSEALTTTLTTLVTIGAGVWALIRRYKAGGVSVMGVRK